MDKDKLKEEQKAELQNALEAYEQEFLKSFSATRAGEVIKKFDFPTLQPLTKVQRENKMLDMVHQAVWHAFVSHASVMTNTVHNALIKTLDEGGFQGYTGPAYHQTSQLNFTPIGSATTTPPVVSQSQPKGSIGVTQPIGSTMLPQFNLVFTNSTPLTTSMQGGFALGHPATSLGMPPEIFFPSGAGQTSTSAS